MLDIMDRAMDNLADAAERINIRRIALTIAVLVALAAVAVFVLAATTAATMTTAGTASLIACGISLAALAVVSAAIAAQPND